MAAQTYTPVEMLARLVAFDTTSRGSNLALIRFVQDYLKEHGVASTLTHDDGGAKANLFATLGSGTEGGIVLSGHTDVVPVDGQDWVTDPFTLVEKDGRLYGRGTTDMKGFLATALALVPDMVRARPKTPLHLALSYDEEVGCLGVPRLIEGVLAAGLRPRAVIVGEPTEMKVVDGHKGIFLFETVVTGREAHSSIAHTAVSAIFYAAELVTFLHRLAKEMRDRAKPETGFDPPYTTVHVGLINGGTANNIIPRRCAFLWEYRLLPGEPESEVIDRFEAFAAGLVPEMKAVADEAGIATRRLVMLPPLNPDPGSAAEQLALVLAGSNRTYKAPYGTEAGLFQGAGMATVVCGPGAVGQAHQPNEFVARSEIDACEAFLRRLVAHVATR
ncbi:MAG: acetylornithine deacetylase [Alphaproteobacteria bacterium]|nr:acetylornithine deacetylase [Alphaproteobacteria bacterium]